MPGCEKTGTGTDALLIDDVRSAWHEVLKLVREFYDIRMRIESLEPRLTELTAKVRQLTTD